VLALPCAGVRRLWDRSGLLDMLAAGGVRKPSRCRRTFVNAMCRLWPGLFYVLARRRSSVILIRVAHLGPDSSSTSILAVAQLVRSSLSRALHSPHRAMCSALGWWWRSCSAKSWNAGYRAWMPISMAEPGPFHCHHQLLRRVSVGCCAAIRLGRGWWLVLLAVAILGVASAPPSGVLVAGARLGVQRARPCVLLISVVAALLLLLIPTAGIYSLIGITPYWEGWLTGPAQTRATCFDLPLAHLVVHPTALA